MHEQLEQALKNISQTGTLVQESPARQVWRFAFGGRSYLLHFHRRNPSRIARWLHGNVGVREFFYLQEMQKKSISARRAIALLQGFRIDAQTGDAVLLDDPESTTLRDWLERPSADGNVRRRDVLIQLISLLEQLGRARFGHTDLSLDSFILVDGRLQFADATNVRAGGLRTRHLMRLAHDARRFATRADVVRVWRAMSGGDVPPRKNSQSPKRWRAAFAKTLRTSEHFKTVTIADWSGIATTSADYVRPWSLASSLRIDPTEWQIAWPDLLARIERGETTAIKQDASGDVLATSVTLGGRSIDVIIKRPKRKTPLRELTSLLRPSRAKRTWKRTWKLLVRDIATEWPLLILERRGAGMVPESFLVFERVPGSTLAASDLDTLSEVDRINIFFRTGRVLRTIDELGFAHFDAKSTNWIVFPDPVRGPTPVLLDCDGVRHYRWAGAGIERLLRAMRQHPQYTPTDSLWLCRGYAPLAMVAQEEAEPEQVEEDDSQQDASPEDSTTP